MKHLRYLFILLLFAFSGTSNVFAQLTVQPSVVCDGDQVAIIIDQVPAIPAGATFLEYHFNYGSPLIGQGVNANPNILDYTFSNSVPGTWHGTAWVIYTNAAGNKDSSAVGGVDFVVYYKPIVDFSINPGSNDTQCYAGGTNVFCFKNDAHQNPNTPSNPLASCYWVFGDGIPKEDCNPVVCHTYGIIKQYDVTLTITDSKGCTADTTNPPALSNGNGVVVVGSTPPDFKWIQVSGPCFKSCYKFTNLSTATVNKIKAYQWDFGDMALCESYYQSDSSRYTALAPLNPLPSACDSALHIFDLAYFDTIVHCYCDSGMFKPMLKIIDEQGCADSILKTPQNSVGIQLPINIKFTFDITTSKAGPGGPGENILSDSVCAGDKNSSAICFNQTPISYAGPGNWLWNFGDPNDPNLKNEDSVNWHPCHVYSGMGSFFPSLQIKGLCQTDTIVHYYSATMVGPYNRFLDTSSGIKNDILDPTISLGEIPTQSVPYKNIGGIGFNGQAIVLNKLDSVQLIFDKLVLDPVTGNNFAKYKMAPRHKYYGDTAYYFNTQSFASPYPPYGIIPPDSIPVYKYYDFVPDPETFVPPAKIFQAFKDSIVPVSYGLDSMGAAADLCLGTAASSSKHKYVFNSIMDANHNILPSIWYKFARSYNYGVRILGPVAGIENPNIPVVIKASQKNQCGPKDTIDFVNTSAIAFKAGRVWRRWDFGDIYAPQCTSFTQPHPGWPRISKIDSFAYFRPKANNNDYLSLEDTLIVIHDTTRTWTDAMEQYVNSDHYFISNGKMYPGKRNCNFSHDTLPRHHYPNWDSVYLWYRYGHDFMPWDTTRWTTDPAKVSATRAMVKQWDLQWWNKPVYLNVTTGEWSLTPGHSVTTSYLDTFTYLNPITHLIEHRYKIKDTLPGISVEWPRIDTMDTDQTPQDITPGGNNGGLRTSLVPDPFETPKGGYSLISGIVVDTAEHTPLKSYVDVAGRRIDLPNGKTLLPDGTSDFFEYVFRRTIQKCLTVTLKLADSLNNESGLADSSTSPLDITRLDMWDCSSEATVQLALGKPDARGMGKKGQECPGFGGSPALTFNFATGFPGVEPNCGRTSIYLNIDSLADRMDNTPCYLDAFTTWGPTPTLTPGGLTRTTWHKVIKWPPIPTDPWTGPSESIFQYHMGGDNPDTDNPADVIDGFVTIGLYVGNGQKDSVIDVWASNYNTNTTNNGTALYDYLGIGPYASYKTLPLIRRERNLATPPFVDPIPPGWADDSIDLVFKFNQILSRKPQIRPSTGLMDTLFEIEYLDPNWPNCISDTVWYHNFWRIKNVNALFYKSPSELNGSTLRERYDTLMVIYEDSIQDSIKVTVWDWADKTFTIDSFHYAGMDTTDSFFTHGVRRVRYNTTKDALGNIIVLDSLVNPCGAYGDRQSKQAIRFYRRIFDSIGFKAPDTLILRNKCPNPKRYDSILTPYTNYHDTLYLSMADTVLYTQFKTIDTALMMLPVQHRYTSTSWEESVVAPRGPAANINSMLGYIANTQNCNSGESKFITVGAIDTLHIYDVSGAEDTVFCKSEPVYFVDSIRYFRYDNDVTNPLNLGRSRAWQYGDYPFKEYYFDTTDFWARDVNNPSDTLNLSNDSNGVLWNKFLVDFKYFPGKWTHYDEENNYLPDLTGHWDYVLRGGDVPVLLPSSASDPADNTPPQIGKIMFYPGIEGGFGPAGLYLWDASGNWVRMNSPIITVDVLSSYTDLSQTPGAVIGQLIYNNGKGAVSRVGMYYWDGTVWKFIANSKYTTFPYLTHRLYWDFGDGTPVYEGVRPIHKYEGFGRFKVTMVSRDSVGAFDTCISFVLVAKPVAKPFLFSHFIGCKDTASFRDSSYIDAGSAGASVDQVVGVNWWFNLKYSYPDGLQGQDTITIQSIASDPTWFYNQKGIFKVKIAIVTEQGCRDTAYDSITVQGPRPAFALFTDTIGCKPFRVGIWNLADSFDMKEKGDTPTRTTVFYWGDGQKTTVSGRRDTVYHIYNDTGTYSIVAAGSDASEFGVPTCPITYAPIPDTTGVIPDSIGYGFQRPVRVIVREPYHTEIVSSQDTVCVGQSFDVSNLSDGSSYSAYRFERRYDDSTLTFIDSVSKSDTGPFTTKFDSVGKYKIILFPTDYQPSVPLTARCAIQDTVSITALQPKADFTMDTIAFPLYKFTNTSVGSDYYDWIFYEKDGSERKRERVFPPTINWSYGLGDDTGRFQVCLIAYVAIPGGSAEGCPDTTCKTVNNVYITKIIIPNVFTPNGDGFNDFFKVDIEGEAKYDMMIFNRWGTKVFTSDNKNKMWNGKNDNDGSECASGTYFFVFSYQLRGTEEAKTVHGTITLIKE